MKRPELIYWRGSGEVRSDLLQAIKVVGYDLTTVSEIDDVLKRKAEDLPGIVVVDASAGEAEASQRVIEMSAAGPLSQTPIIFLSYQATKRSAVLKKTFAKFLPIDIPFRLQVLLEKFLELCPVPTAAAAPEIAAELAAQPPVVVATATSAGPVVAPARVVIKTCDPSKIKPNYGGEFFALADTLDRVDDNLLLPVHPQRDQLVRALNTMTAQDEWMGLHARRVGFLSSALATALGIEGERDRRIRTAGLFLNWGLLERFPHYASHDLLLLSEERYLKLIGNAFSESARFVRESIQDPGAAQTIQDVANIVLLNSHPADAVALIDAHCVLTPELADRSSWAKLQWDPYGVHRVVRKFIDGEPFQFSQDVVHAISRAMSEAASVRLLLNPLPPLPDEASGQYEGKLISEAQREAEQLFHVKKQLSMQLADLRPGMRLSQPIISWDGKLILRANVSLSEDLIERLLRLSAVRPVRPPVAVLAAAP